MAEYLSLFRHLDRMSNGFKLEETFQIDNCIAHGKLNVSLGKMMAPAGLYFSKVFGIVGKDGCSTYKFMLEVEVKKIGFKLPTLERSNLSRDVIKVCPDDIDVETGRHLPFDFINYSIKLTNLNKFAVNINYDIMLNVFGIQRKGIGELEPGSSIHHRVERQVFFPRNLSNTKIKLEVGIISVPDENPHGGVGMKIASLFNDDTTSDFKIICGDRTFFAHKFVLSRWCDSWDHMFKIEGIQESEKGEMLITDFSPRTVEAFLHFMYTDVIEIADIDTDLLLIADKYFVSQLFKICESHLLNFGFSSDFDVINTAIVGYQVNSQPLMDVALRKAFRSINGYPELAKDWAKVCHESPEWSHALAKKFAARRNGPVQVFTMTGESISLIL